MKLSEKTLAILDNFKNLNSSILFYPGTEIKNLSSDKSVYASATIEDEIPIKFAVFNLRELLNVIGVVKDADIDFRDDHLYISNPHNSVVFRYTSPKVVDDVYNRKITLGEPEWELNLPAEQVRNMFKMSRFLEIPDVRVVPEAEGRLVLYNAKGSHSHEYTVNTECPTNGDPITFNISVLNLMDCAYNVACYPGKNIVRFSGVEIDIKYHIPFKVIQ